MAHDHSWWLLWMVTIRKICEGTTMSPLICNFDCETASLQRTNQSTDKTHKQQLHTHTEGRPVGAECETSVYSLVTKLGDSTHTDTPHVHIHTHTSLCGDTQSSPLNNWQPNVTLPVWKQLVLFRVTEASVTWICNTRCVKDIKSETLLKHILRTVFVYVNIWCHLKATLLLYPKTQRFKLCFLFSCAHDCACYRMWCAQHVCVT